MTAPSGLLRPHTCTSTDGITTSERSSERVANVVGRIVAGNVFESILYHAVNRGTISVEAFKECTILFTYTCRAQG